MFGLKTKPHNPCYIVHIRVTVCGLVHIRVMVCGLVHIRVTVCGLVHIRVTDLSTFAPKHSNSVTASECPHMDATTRGVHVGSLSVGMRMKSRSPNKADGRACSLRSPNAIIHMALTTFQIRK